MKPLMNFKQKQKLKRNIKQFFKKIRNIILFFLCVIIIILISISGNHFIKKHNEVNELKDYGMYNLIEVGDTKMNVVKKGYGQEHTLVMISDIETDNFSVYMTNMTRRIEDNVSIVIADRPGYGMSKDTTLERTVDNIVQEYRHALQRMNATGPYILVASQFGSVYATYWESNYPDEIEGVIYINPVDITEEGELELTYPIPEKKDYANAIFSKFGFQRLFYEDFTYLPSALVSEKEADLINYLDLNNAFSFAKLSEMELAAENYKTTYETMKKNNIPKMYICSKYTCESLEEFQEYVDYLNKKSTDLGKFNPIEYDEIEELRPLYDDIKVTSRVALKDSVRPFMNNLGNCHMVKLYGDDIIYEQYLYDVGAAIEGFIRYLDGQTITIYDRYYDANLLKWKAFAATLPETATMVSEEGDDIIIYEDNENQKEEHGMFIP